MKNEKKFFTPVEFAQELGVNRSTVGRWIANGMPCHSEFKGTRFTFKIYKEEAFEWIMKEREKNAEKRLRKGGDINE